MSERIRELMLKWEQRSKSLYKHDGHDKLVAVEIEKCRTELYLVMNEESK